jgi:hypothetical protein
VRLLEWSDRFWERLKARSLRLQAADATPDQSHTHHALVVVLLFGSVFAGLALLASMRIELGLKAGFIVGWIFYAIREIAMRVEGGFRYKPWDGVCDIVVPLWVTLPVVIGSASALWILSWIVVLLLRPIPRQR